MTILGTLLGNQRSRDAKSAWSRPNLQGPETLTVSSTAFGAGASIPKEHVGKRVGGRDVSPPLRWSEPPAGAAALLLVVEDVDVPLPTPAVHCLALIDPSLRELPAGALSARAPGAGVQILRSTLTRGYHGPEPIKGHGPHRYTFQLFALSAALDASALRRTGPRAVLAGVTAAVLARGELTGVYER